MGLFDRFKKQKNVEVQEEVQQAVEEIAEAKAEAQQAVEEIAEAKAEAQQAAEEIAEAKAQDAAEEIAEAKADPNEVRRFTLLIEDLSPLPEEQGVVVGGILYGTVQKGDEIYIIHPMGTISTTKVDGIEVGPNQTADRAQNQKITMLLKGVKDVNQVPKYTVLTSIKPQTTVDANTAVENPQLLGLSMDYPRLCKDNTYMNLLVYVVCHANYVVPASVDKAAAENGDTRMRFPSLQDPADKSRNLFPVFTDYAALANWKNLFDENHPPKAIIMPFPNAVKVCNGNGIVINPFGPMPILLADKMIEQIVGMEGYKKEFGADPVETVKKVQMEQEAKVMVGVPKENDEIKLIKEAMIAQAKKEAEIKRVDFLLKVDVQKERAYLCIVDCPEEQATKLFTGLHKAAAPYFNEVKRLEFLLYGKSKLANDVVSEKSCIYQA